MERDTLLKLKAWAEALLQAKDALAAVPPVNPEPVDVAAFLTAQRNQVLANSGDKAALLGTLSTPPVLSEADLAKVVGAALADAFRKDRDICRAAALALPVDAEPIKVVKP